MLNLLFLEHGWLFISEFIYCHRLQPLPHLATHILNCKSKIHKVKKYSDHKVYCRLRYINDTCMVSIIKEKCYQKYVTRSVLHLLGPTSSWSCFSCRKYVFRTERRLRCGTTSLHANPPPTPPLPHNHHTIHHVSQCISCQQDTCLDEHNIKVCMERGSKDIIIDTPKI